MSEDLILQLGHETLKTTALLATPMLLGALLVGLVISVLQAITQINEATLTFIPKMIIVGVIFLLAAPWMLDVLQGFTVGLFENMAEMVRIR
ncbi:MAG: flagellar biosynthesis protein FliQ [Bdellovibrionales bacterium]|nr:flagellar biosynthesis protein FliQ [Bdellovibrionales bacterium]